MTQSPVDLPLLAPAGGEVFAERHGRTTLVASGQTILVPTATQP